MKITSIHLIIFLKSHEFFEKASHHFKKVLILLKMSSKRLVVFEKALDFSLKPPLKPHKYNQKPQNRSKCLTLLEKASVSL
jgi:hypothetical protein